MRSRWLRGSSYWVLLFRDWFAVTKPLSQIQRRTLLFLQQASYTPSFGGLGLRHLPSFLGPPHLWDLPMNFKGSTLAYR